MKTLVKNTGDAPANSLLLKAAVPKKLAAKPRPIRLVSLAAGESATRTFRIKVKKFARRGKKITVKVSAIASGLKAITASARPVKIR